MNANFFEPKDVIVPIFAMDDQSRLTEFLGTASFVEPEPLLLTANHVLQKAGERRVAIVHMPDNNRGYVATPVHIDAAHDIALLRVEGYAPALPLRVLGERLIHPNETVFCFEYGTTIVTGAGIELNPATRVGNVTRIIDARGLIGAAGENALELSFPALKGASGAPAVLEMGYMLQGMVVANISYELLPSQIERVFDPHGNMEEETKFMLPLAIAVSFRHVANAISDFRKQQRKG